MKWQRMTGIAWRKGLWPVRPAWLGSESRQRRRWFICVCAKQVALDERSPGSILPTCRWVPRATMLLGAETSGGSSRTRRAVDVWGLCLSSSSGQNSHGLTPDVHTSTPDEGGCGCGTTSITWEKRPETGMEGDGASQLPHALRYHRSHWQK